MENKTLLSFGIEEIKEKLFRFFFSGGGFFSGFYNIELVKNDDQIIYTFSHTFKESKDEYNFTKEKWNEFIEKIFNENIQNWKNKYHDNNICDGYEWELEMEFKDLPKFESCGSNEYPRNWKKFMTIIYEYFPQMKEKYEDEEDVDD